MSRRRATRDEIEAAARDGEGGLVQLLRRTRAAELQEAGIEVTP